MAHAAAHTAEELKATRKKYFNVFWGLVALTIIELVIVYLPIGQTLITLGVAIFSSAKAVVVGYYYMHLEYETRWLKIIASLPIIAFGYAFVLMADAPTRPASFYSHEPARVFRGESHTESQSNTPVFAEDVKALEGDVLRVEAVSGRGEKVEAPAAAAQAADSVQTQSPSAAGADQAQPAAGAGAGAAPADSGSSDGGEWN
jgi:cytochrome c oxidase subunit 4